MPAETLYSLADAPPSPADRRDSERQLTLFRVGALTIGKRRELCLVRNVSAGGMMVRIYCPIEPGTRVSAEVKCGESVGATILWVTGDTAGLGFDQPVDVVELLKTSMEGPRPRMPRVEVDCVAWIRQGADTCRVSTSDVSQGGVKIVTEADLTLDSEIIVTLPGLPPVAAVARWRHGDCYGLTFNKVLPLPLLVGWLHGQRERLRAAG